MIDLSQFVDKNVRVTFRNGSNDNGTVNITTINPMFPYVYIGRSLKECYNRDGMCPYKGHYLNAYDIIQIEELKPMKKYEQLENQVAEMQKEIDPLKREEKNYPNLKPVEITRTVTYTPEEYLKYCEENGEEPSEAGYVDYYSEPEMPITKPEFYDNLTPGDKTCYNVAEKEVSKQWAIALTNFIDELGGDGPALWGWEDKTPTPEKVVECLRDNIQYIADGELESCCVVVEMNEGRVSGNVLRAIRRPQPTLKSQALKDFETVRKHSDLLPEILDTIENALKSLPE